MKWTKYSRRWAKALVSRYGHLAMLIISFVSKYYQNKYNIYFILSEKRELRRDKMNECVNVSRKRVWKFMTTIFLKSCFYKAFSWIFIGKIVKKCLKIRWRWEKISYIKCCFSFIAGLAVFSGKTGKNLLFSSPIMIFFFSLNSFFVSKLNRILFWRRK